MDSKELSRQEYIARINRVMDYIGRNLEKQIDLGVMAQIASFSPYHFHRIFSYIVGETPNDFISRIRLEKTAQLLRDNPKALVNNIAFQCGFINASSFSRAFKAYFGVTTKEFREQEAALFLKDGIRYSKDGKAVSKIGKHPQQVNDDTLQCRT